MADSSLTRRGLLAAAGFAGSGFALTAADDPPPAEPFPASGEVALARLKAGNARFAAGKTRHAHMGADWRKHLVGGQRPFATVLGCSDSRVPTELVFDQGFGDVFVIRVAGNVVADDVVGSMAYAALHLRTPLFVVLGHAGCGAVTAAVEELQKKGKEPERIEALLKLIEPGLKGVDLALPTAKAVDAAVEANVRWALKQLTDMPAVKSAIERHRYAFVGAVYDLQSGSVRFLG